ncbi:transglutaminase TgpA family protein [Sandaracinus amylolyticus]|uniref:transglutaminase TgpA family protein n=1 Tax=Sandaracinus amylolyticus TaxID=927083 RepID=UPI001F33B858|nr:DUF3488 and transglutaminase-like domain-containing protein [Sandaracinus amylolyticus]UJR86507.1 Hypothetical protein I5071_86020 [Sandaracinus amylolyticus]
MSFTALHKHVTYMMAGLGLAALFLGGELSLFVQALIVAGFVASVFVEGPRLHQPGWQRGWNVALLGLFALAIVRGVLGEPLLPLALELTAGLQISRLCNRRSATEHQQIAMLAFLQLCAATVLSTELTYGIAFLGFVVVAPWMLALTHLRSEIEGHYPGDPDPGRAADVRRVLASRRVVGPSFLVGTAALSLPLFLMTAALFVLFPRVGLGMLSFGRGSPTHVAGFGGDVELGQVGLVRDDPTVVMRVVPPGIGPEITPPSRAAIRMRGTSFDRYDGRRWSRTLREPRAVRRYDDYYPIERVPDLDRDLPFEIVLDHLDDPVVFLPDRAVAVQIPGRVTTGIEIGRRLTLEPGLDLRYEADDALGLRYRAWVAEPGSRREDPEPLDAASAAPYLQVPPGHERVARLAREWTEGAISDRDRAERIQEQLRAMRYSLDMQDPGTRLPLDAFLFDWRAGHCEYFSTAMAIMLRSLGVPARNATGFLGGRWNTWGRWYAITNGDAHSWVEVWLEGEGWVTFDPTPPSRGEVDFARGLLDELSAMIDALRTSWESDVIGYDLRAQRSLARRFAQWMRELGASSPSGGARISADEPTRARAGAPLPWTRIVAIVALAIVIGAAIAVVRRRRDAQARVADVPESAREVVALYRALERALETLGRGRPLDRTPREHAALLEAEGFVHAAIVREVTERYLAVRFGGETLAPSELARLREQLRDVKPT